jgi:hypothetical protein
MRPWIWMLAVATAAAIAPASARADARDELLAYVLQSAEHDFDVVRDEAALSGSAPLVGMKAEKKPARKQAKGSRARAEAKARADAKRVSAISAKPAAVGRP